MGSEASKTVDPPDDWEPKGAVKSFEIISPVSDISNPSDIHRFHPKPSRTHLAQRGDGTGRRDRPIPSSRRVSKTVTTSLPLKAVSRNSRGSSDNVPTPSAFYFPTKESERYEEQRVKSIEEVAVATQHKENAAPMTDAKNKKMKMRKNIFKVITSCLDDRDDGKIHLQEPPQVRPKVAQTSMQVVPRRDCLVKQEVPLRKIKNDASEKLASSEAKRSNDDTKVVSEASVVASKVECGQNANVNPYFEHQEDYLDAINSMTSLALHQEDAYFDRLSLSSNQEASPFVTHGATNRVFSIQQSKALRFADSLSVETPLEKWNSGRTSMPLSLDAPLDTTISEMVNPVRRSLPVSVDISTDTDSSQLMRQLSRRSILGAMDTSVDTPVSEHLNTSTFLSERKRQENSPVSSLLRFYSKTGPMESSPALSYQSEEEDSEPIRVFSDDLSEAHSQKAFNVLDQDDKEGDISKRESRESHSSLYTTESKSYEKVDGKEFQLLVPQNYVPEEDSEVLSYFRTEQRRDKVAFAAIPTKKATVVKNRFNLVAALGPAKPNRRDDEATNNISKLESLFRPVLPALSSDDAQSVSSCDPYEIKVTESAPGLIQTENYVSLALRKPSPQNSVTRMNQLALLSPSMVSIDTQREQSPSLAKILVSDQAEHNAEFLFANDYGPIKTARGPNGARDSSTLSISTAGARSRLTQRSFTRTNGIILPVNSRDETESSTRRSSSDSYKGERRVRFSTETVKLADKRDSAAPTSSRGSLGEVEIPAIESRVSDLTDAVQDNCRRDSGIVSTRSSATSLKPLSVNSGFGMEGVLVAERDEQDTTIQGGSGGTPDMEGIMPVASTISSYLRSEQANDQAGNKFAAYKASFSESIDLPEIERKVSDLTEAASIKSRQSSESYRTFQSFSVEEAIPEGDEKADLSPETSIHWTYSETGVTPYYKGNSLDNATKSPFIRFKNAKNKFSMDSGKDLPTKNPKKISKVIKKESVGIVSARIEELNSRVTEIRKMKRMRKKMTNPRLHTHNFDNTQPVRNRALINYKTNIKSADTVNSNTVMAAKFNVIPDVDDDDNCSFLTSGTNAKELPRYVDEEEEYDHDDDVSKLSEAMSSVACSSVATVRQERDGSLRSRAHSEVTKSTTSSGFTNIKKQVFRVSDASISLTSNGESTTLSAIIQKENESYLPFRAGTFNTMKTTERQLVVAPPSELQRTPMQAMKWRSLAVAAQEKDALKASASIKKQPRGLSLRSVNSYK